MLVFFFLLAFLASVCNGEENCVYNRRTYRPGDTWTTVEGCNTCGCTDNGMICSFQDCNLKRFAKPGKYADCISESDWYGLHDFWLLKDGCNTCYCAMPGNYRGYQICTKSDCSIANPQIV